MESKSIWGMVTAILGLTANPAAVAHVAAGGDMGERYATPDTGIVATFRIVAESLQEVPIWAGAIIEWANFVLWHTIGKPLTHAVTLSADT